MMNDMIQDSVLSCYVWRLYVMYRKTQELTSHHLATCNVDGFMYQPVLTHVPYVLSTLIFLSKYGLINENVTVWYKSTNGCWISVGVKWFVQIGTGYYR